MKATISALAKFAFFLLLGCSASQPKEQTEKPITSGRELILQVIRPEDNKARSASKFGGLLTTAFSSLEPDPMEPLKRLTPDDQENRKRIFTAELSDGTKELKIQKLKGGHLF